MHIEISGWVRIELCPDLRYEYVITNSVRTVDAHHAPFQRTGNRKLLLDPWQFILYLPSHAGNGSTLFLLIAAALLFCGYVFLNLSKGLFVDLSKRTFRNSENSFPFKPKLNPNISKKHTKCMIY